jgi:GntR family transcriptional regulator, vanillate catabolism transcriptional regulator
MSDLKTKVVVELRKMIMDGIFSPGDRVAEVPIAERLDVSRTPVRAALAVLEQEGLLLASTTGGYTVRSFTLEAISDAIDVRGTLEGLAARQLAEHGLSRALAQGLQACLSEGESILSTGKVESDSFPRFAEMNVKFHGLIVDGSGNLAVLRALALNDAIPFSAASSVVDTRSDPLESYQGLVHSHFHHRAIVEALTEGAGARVEALMREHSNATKSIVRRMRELRHLPVPGAHLISV